MIFHLEEYSRPHIHLVESQLRCKNPKIEAAIGLRHNQIVEALLFEFIFVDVILESNFCVILVEELNHVFVNLELLKCVINACVVNLANLLSDFIVIIAQRKFGYLHHPLLPIHTMGLLVLVMYLVDLSVAS
tara:strand:+ start:710 stop:1105 length:396 start_codon:yes stop_codon:yes gene_type:complete